MLDRRQNLSHDRATTQEEVDRARAERDVALAQIARTKAIIDRKTIRAPFRARVGMADVHPGQYLNEGTELTTLQGVDDAVHVDFTVAQQVAAGLREGDSVEVSAAGQPSPIPAKIVAVDARVDPTTRNAMVRARIEGAPTRRRPAPRCASGFRSACRARPSPSPSARCARGRAATTCSSSSRTRTARPARTCGRSRAARCSATRS